MSRPLKYKYYLAASDIIILLMSVFFSLYFVDQNNNLDILTASLKSESGIFVFVFLGAVYLFVFESSKLYKPSTILKESEHFNAVVRAVFYISGGLILVSLILSFGNILQSSFLVITFAGTSILLLYLYRVKIITPFYLNGEGLARNVLLVNRGAGNDEIISDIVEQKDLKIAGVAGAQKFSNAFHFPSIETEYLHEFVSEKKINEVVVVSSEESYNELIPFIDSLRSLNASIKVISPLFNVISERVKSEYIGNIPAVTLSNRQSLYVSLGIKRAIDIAGALAGILVLSPLFIVLAILIKLTSKGPVFFKQMRIGKDGKQFKFFKFRSMYNIQGEDVERVKMMMEFIKKDKIEAGDSKVVNESRVTSIGKFIRRTSIDELPQLYNVLKGDMSLVGPRPDVPYVYEQYDDWQKTREQILPGCTGVWQVTGRSFVTFNETMLLDIYYVHNISFLLDLEMILKTIPVMLFSYGGR